MTKKEIKNFCEKYKAKAYPDNNRYLICLAQEVYDLKRQKFLSKTFRKRNPKNINSKCDVYISLNTSECKFSMSLHRVMAKTFLCNKDNLPEVNHKDGDPSNNNIDNLEWCTREHNMQHVVDNKLFGNYTKCMKSRLVYKETLIDTFRTVKMALESELFLDISGSTNISKTCKLNESIEAGSYEKPYQCNQLVCRYTDTETTQVTQKDPSGIGLVKTQPIRGFENRYVITEEGFVYDMQKKQYIKRTSVIPKKGTPFMTSVLHVEGRKYKTIRNALEVYRAFVSPRCVRVGHKNQSTLDCKLDNLYNSEGERDSNKCISVYKLGWVEVDIEEFHTIRMAASTVDSAYQSVADVANKNTKIDPSKEPYKSGGYVFRAL